MTPDVSTGVATRATRGARSTKRPCGDTCEITLIDASVDTDCATMSSNMEVNSVPHFE